MNKKEIISILHKENVLKDIGSGPTVVVVSNGKKKLLMRVKRKGNHITVSTGRILRRTFRIPISKKEQ